MDWFTWGACLTAECGPGSRRRTQFCDHFMDYVIHGNVQCKPDIYAVYDYEECATVTAACEPGHRFWTEWVPIGPCSQTCGRGGTRPAWRERAPDLKGYENVTYDSYREEGHIACSPHVACEGEETQECVRK